MIARYGDTDYGYSEAGYGYGVSAFTGFDGLSIIPDTLGWWSVARRVLNRYTGPAIRLRRSSDSAERDFYGIGPQGEVSTAAVRAWNGWNLVPNSGNLSTGWAGANGGTIISAISFSTNDPTSRVQQVPATMPAGTYTITAKFGVADVGKSIRLAFFAGSWDTGVNITIDANGFASRTFTAGASVTNIAMAGLSTITTVTYTAFEFIQVERAAAFSTYEPRTTTGAGDSFLVTLYEQAENGRNLFSQTEFPNGLSDLNVTVGLSTSTSSMGPLGTVPVLVFGDNSTQRYGYKNFSPTSGATYTISFYVKMDDGLAPVIGTSVSSGDFTIIAFSSFAVDNITTQDLGGGVYRVSATRSEATTDNNWGLIKYTGQSSRGFVTSGWQLEVGTTATTYERRTTHGAGTRLNFTQSTTTLQPIICEQGVPVTENGRLAAKFVAADARRMSIASSTAMFNALHTTGGTVLCVSRANDTAATKSIVRNNAASTLAGFAFGRSGGENVFTSSARLDVAGVATNGNSMTLSHGSIASTAQSIVAALYDPDNATAASRVFAWQNGTASTDANASTGTPFVENASGNLTLGAASDGSLPHDGPISEVALFSALISTADRTAWQSRSGVFYTVAIS